MDGRGGDGYEESSSSASGLSASELAEIEHLSKEVVDAPLPLAIVDGIGEQIVRDHVPIDPSVVRQEVTTMYLREVRRHPELSLGGDARTQGQQHHAEGLIEALEKQVDESFTRMQNSDGGALQNKEIRL